MKTFSPIAIALLALAISIPAFGDDQQKAQKQLHKVTAMATDGTGRRIVSMTVADLLAAKRNDLVMERRATGLSYGDIFLAHLLVKNGAKMDDIAAQLKAKKTMAEIANDQHADWKQIAAEAKKLNAKVEDNLYKHFLNAKANLERDQADKYDPNFDGVSADNDVSKDEIAEAETTYQMWRERAEKTTGGSLDTVTEKSAREMRGDPVANSPGSHSDSQKTPPN